MLTLNEQWTELKSEADCDFALQFCYKQQNQKNPQVFSVVALPHQIGYR